MYRKAFLAPWDPRVADVFLYALADAQRHTGMAVHSGTLVVSHHHTEVTPREQNVAEFFRRIHGDISCATNALLADGRYDVPRTIFDKRQTHAMRLLDAPAQMSQLLYDHLNPVAAGFVSEARYMPGPQADFRHWKTGGVTVKRPDVYFDKTRPEELRLVLTPPPLLMDAFDGDLDALVYHLDRIAKDATRRMQRARTRPVMGAQKLRRMHPWSEPKTLAEPGGQRVPTFKSGAAGLTGKRIRSRASREVTSFRNGHRGSRDIYRTGDRDVVFPYGTDLMRRHHGVNVAEPDPHAIVCGPGPLLEDVLADCDARRQRRDDREVPAHAAIVDEVQAAWVDEADDVVADANVEYLARNHGGAGAAPNSGPQTPSDGTQPAPTPTGVRVQHRLDARADTERDPATRVVTLRDNRRRPKANAPPH